MGINLTRTIYEKVYKGFAYRYSKIRGCWKIFHNKGDSFMLMDYESESHVKAWINDNQWQIKKAA